MTAEFDPATPNMARVYDYWLDGKDNYPADRAEAERLLTIYPPLRDLVRENRAFVTRAVTTAPMDQARSITSVLHYRLEHLALQDIRHDASWVQRTPASAPSLAHELAAALDDRARALGEQFAASPEPWLARQLGVLAPAASLALRSEYTRRAGIAAAYREAAGITNPDQTVSPEPHRGNPELEAMRKAVFAALEIRDEADIIRGLDRGEFEARARKGQRARAAAPPDVSRQLRLTAQAEADAYRQSADARTQHDHTAAASVTALAAQLTAERQRLEAANARYEQWSADTYATRDAAGRATAELRRRGHAQPDSKPHPQPGNEQQPMAGWWHQLEADTGALNCADASGHHAVSNSTDFRLPQRIPDMNSQPAFKPQPQTSPESKSVQENRTARLDELILRANQAKQRIAAQQAERQASEYAARIELQARIQAEAGGQAQARDEVELELLHSGSSVLPDEPLPSCRSGLAPCFTAGRTGQDPVRQVYLLRLAAGWVSRAMNSSDRQRRSLICYTSCTAVRTAPARRSSAPGLGKTPAASVRRSISLFSRFQRVGAPDLQWGQRNAANAVKSSAASRSIDSTSGTEAP